MLSAQNVKASGSVNAPALDDGQLSTADEMEFDNGRAKTAHKHRLLLLLDEFPSAGPY